jgi:hypothetical protein
MDLRHTETRRPTLIALLRAVHEAPDTVGEILKGVVDRPSAWEELTLWADHEGVLGVVGPLLLADSGLPGAVRAAIERHRAVQDLWQGHLLRGLEAAVTALSNAGVRSCALKGPALAARLYPDGATRPSLDVDLLTDAGDLDQSVATLAGLGYRAETGPTADYLRRYGHHLHLAAPGSAPIELHFRAYSGFGIVLPAEVLLDRARRFEFPDGFAVLVPCPEDEFLYLAIHAAGHSFSRLLWLNDLQRLVRRYPGLDWDRVFRVASRMGIAFAVAYVATLLSHWFSISIPDHGCRSRLGVRGRAADWLLPIVSRPSEPSTRDAAESLVFTSLLCDRTRSAAWLLQHHALRATRRRLHGFAPRLAPADWAA